MSCKGQKKASMEITASSQSELDSSLVLLLQDDYSGFVSAETMLIRDQKRLQRFYAILNKTRKPGLALPEVDFSKEMIVVQCSGEQNYMGMPILSLSRETDTEVVLTVTIDRKVKDTSLTVRTNPFCIYKMPRTDKEIVVEKEMK